MLPIGTILKHSCPECGGKMILKPSKFGLFYGCGNYPFCTATHGAHRATGEPLGTPANKETKLARIAAHNAFDKLWKSKKLTRSEAYAWLAQEMDVKTVYIGEMNTEECKKTEAFAIQLFEKLRNY